jgi:hypothetical protein
MSDDERKFEDFMNKKKIVKEECEGDHCGSSLPNKERPINQDGGGTAEDTERFLLMARILNFLVLLPLGLVFIAGAGYIFVKLMPMLLSFIRFIIFEVLFGG